MGKKDYELIALAFRDALEGCTSTEQKLGVSAAAQSVARRLKHENGAFLVTKFIIACGLVTS
jgi:hypothetical protein